MSTLSLKVSATAERTIDSMKTGFIVAMLVIFFVLTLQFKSYFQPFLIMSIIPFGLNLSA